MEADNKYKSLDYEDLEEFLRNPNISFQRKGNSSFSFKRKEDELILENDSDDIKYKKALKCLKRVFELDDDFDEYFYQATSGSGKECDKIDSIWSSSLLSLLFFYSAIKSGGLRINNILYTKCYFEFKNPVLQNRPHYTHPSNMDCVLMDQNKQHFLFIESKFIECVRDFRKKKINDGDMLKDKYGCEGESTKELYDWFKKFEVEFVPHYYYGMKQMITHYSGLKNFTSKKCFHPEMLTPEDKRKEVVDAFMNGAKVALMEVVYDISNIKDGKYANYLNNYKLIQEELVALMQNNDFEVLPMTTYQELANQTNPLPFAKIKEYYHF